MGVSGSRSRSYPGRVQAVQRVPLSFRVAGPVVELKVSKGRRVGEGELLGRIDPRDYEIQVRNLEAQLSAARAQHLSARETHQRVRSLYEHDSTSKADFDRAQAALDVSGAQAAATEQALKAARLALSDTELRAPYAGIVADRLVDAHQTVGAGQPVILFQDVRGMEVQIDIPEREVAELTKTPPEAIFVRFDAFAGEAYPARIKEFATETDPLTQTFPLTLLLDRPPATDRLRGELLPGGLLPGMTASVSWRRGSDAVHETAMVVPLSSVVSDGTGATFVWRVDPGTMTVTRVAVETGELTDHGLVVAAGLGPGDRILAAGVHYITEGQRVRPMEG